MLKRKPRSGLSFSARIERLESTSSSVGSALCSSLSPHSASISGSTSTRSRSNRFGGLKPAPRPCFVAAIGPNVTTAMASFPAGLCGLPVQSREGLPRRGVLGAPLEQLLVGGDRARGLSERLAGLGGSAQGRNGAARARSEAGDLPELPRPQLRLPEPPV